MLEGLVTSFEGAAELEASAPPLEAGLEPAPALAALEVLAGLIFSGERGAGDAAGVAIFRGGAAAAAVGC